MNIKELKIEFRYLCGSFACMSVNSTTGKPIHNDINDEDSIKIFNALIGSKENSILEENRKLKDQQKEFIKYLENFIDKTDYEVNILGNCLYLAWSNAYKEILSKYKEIVGSDKNERV